MLVSAVQEFLTQPLRLGKVIDDCVASGQRHKGSQCQIIPFGPSQACQAIGNALKAQCGLEIAIRQCISTLNTVRDDRYIGSSNREKLAIVGMAGRFPDAASHEKLWELLEQGLAVHREVPRTDLT